jgi:hypothetical protein
MLVLLFLTLAAIAALAALLKSRLFANSQFGAITIADGYTSPYPALLPNYGFPVVWFLAGAQTTGTEKLGFISPYAGTVVDVRAYLTTAPTGSTFIVDLMKNGVTMFTTSANRPTIAISGNASTTTLPDITSVAVGDRLRLDIIQIGSTIAGSSLYVSVTIKLATIA